jgi:transcriptional regulator with XRE-family HTH domain
MLLIMNDYNLLSSEDIQLDLGQKIEQLRLTKNINQAQIAIEAGVSRRTISRLENGQTVSLDTLIRVLKALGIIEQLALLIPDASVRPLERVRRQGRERKRASSKRSPRSAQWTWDDDQEQ